MRALIFLCLFSVCFAHYVPAPLGKDGVVVDTPEVAAEKLEHYHKLAKAGGAIPHYHNHGYSHHVETHDYKYHGPPAPLNHDGTVAETPEVKHVKADRLAALAEAFAKAPKDEHYHGIYKRSASYGGHYHGPPAPLNHDGTVDETPEVKHVKSARLAALSEAFAKAPQGHDDKYYHEEVKHVQPDHDLKYHGPPAPLNHDGTVAETPEVKHLKHAHLAEVAEAFAKAPKGHDEYYHEEVKHEQPHTPLKHHGPPAPLNHDGTVAETPEVKHVKSERLAALAEAFAKAPKDEHYHGIYKRSASFGGHYHGPPAPLNHDGTVAETPEVQHLKHEHLAAVAEAFAKAPKGHDEYYHEEVGHEHHHIPLEHHHTPLEHHYTPVEHHKYHGPPAPLNHDGTVAETPEVQHVKAERLAALAEAFAKAPKDEHYHGIYKRSASYGGHYHGPPAPLNHDGTVAETPEVQHLKHEHLAAVAEAFAKAPKGHDEYYHEEVEHEHHHIPLEHHHTPLEHHYTPVEHHKYHGPPAPLNHDGTVAETPEVQHVKAERLAALAEAFAKAPKDEHYHGIYKRSASFGGHYHGPPAPLNHDGTVAETPEVQHLKHEHLAAVAEAFAKAPQGHDEYYHEEFKHEHHHTPLEHHHTPVEHHKYHGPPAPLNHDGTVAETPEVKHVKSERLAALAHAFAKAPKDEHYHGIYKRSASYGGHYHGPPAPLNHDGTVAETPEVQHLKHEHLAAVAEAFAKAPKGHAEYYHEEDNHEHHHTPLEHHYTHLQYHHTPLEHHHTPVEHHKYHGPPAPLNHDGTVAETPEVQHVKAERLAALAEAFAKAPRDEHHHGIFKRSASFGGHYHGPPAPLNHDGTVAETPEVKHVKAERLAALAEAFAKAPHGHENYYHEEVKHEEPIKHESHDLRYHGPPAPLNHDGTVDETPEVKHLKHAHLAQVAEAFAKAPKHYEHHGLYKRSLGYSQHYHGPPAPLNHDGTVAETPEVQHVKAERLAALAEAFAKAPKNDIHDYKPQIEEEHHFGISPHYQAYPAGGEHQSWNHHVLPAPLNHDGTVAETPEVQARKIEHLAAHHKALASLG